MKILQKTLNNGLKEVPRRFFERIISQKLRALGIEATSILSSELATHILSGNGGSFQHRARKPHPANVTLVFDEADSDELSESVDSFCEMALLKLIERLARSTSQRLGTRLKSDWAKEHILQQNEISAFRNRLEDRWGLPLGQLRMMLTIAREWCPEDNNENENCKEDNKLKLHDILIRLLVRGAFQVTDEIICLLENGFADGAMARWRTLHEIGIVAAVIAKHGESIVERYIAHQAVESKRAMDEYMKCHKQLGYRPLPVRERKKIKKAYVEAITQYEKNFSGNYGWAAKHLKIKNPEFSDLEAEAGRAEMRTYYQLGNNNVHAGIKSIFHRLGLLEHYIDLLAGRSNAGLAEAGLNTALTLMRISVLVCMSDDLDDVVIAHVMMCLCDETQRSFYVADKKLRRDDKEFQTVTAEPPPASATNEGSL